MGLHSRQDLIHGIVDGREAYRLIRLGHHCNIKNLTEGFPALDDLRYNANANLHRLATGGASRLSRAERRSAYSPTVSPTSALANDFIHHWVQAG